MGLIFRVLWQVYPGLLTCALFWLAVISWDVSQVGRFKTLASRGWRIIASFGGVLNAIVTLANGGFMPVVGDNAAFSLWVTATDRHRLLFLADRFAGFSLGDFFIIGGLVAGVVLYCLGKTDPKKKEQA